MLKGINLSLITDLKQLRKLNLCKNCDFHNCFTFLILSERPCIWLIETQKIILNFLSYYDTCRAQNFVETVLIKSVISATTTFPVITTTGTKVLNATAKHWVKETKQSEVKAYRETRELRECKKDRLLPS